MAQEYAFDYNTIYSLEEIQAIDRTATVENDGESGLVVFAIKEPTEYVFYPDGTGWTLDHTWHRFALISKQGGEEG